MNNKKALMNLEDYCSLGGSDEYLQVKNYISKYGADFESSNLQLATDYLNSRSPRNGPVYIIEDSGIYQFIMPV
jgi:hypothetical protein